MRKYVTQRIAEDTQKKLQVIAEAHRPKTTVPALLDAMTDNELTKYPELKEVKE